MSDTGNRTTGSWPKVIRDPIHNVITFENTQTGQLLFHLVNCREFQRLRRIKQLGLSEMVFPGANHSRFAHSIGVMHTAKLFLNQIENAGFSLTDDQKTVVLVSALLHDIGHGPFSHAFEKITRDKHERRTEEIIEDDSTTINKVLKEFDGDLPIRVAAFFQKDPTGENVGDIPPFFVHVVSSQLDADRCDYLLRDSHATGADYGKFDLRWLVDHVYVDENHNRTYLGRKAFYATEQYIFARYHMYQAVYFHKATRSAEVMLRLLFKRYKELLDAEDTLDKKTKVVEGASPALINAFSGELSLYDYLLLDDHTITEFLKCCEVCRDPIIKRLASGLLHRRLYKCVDATGISRDKPDKVAEFREQAKVIVQQYIDVVDYGLASDTPADTPYKVYDPSADNPATQIFVEDSTGQIKPLDHLSDQVNVLRKRITRIRYYFPEEARTDIFKLTKSWKGGN